MKTEGDGARSWQGEFFLDGIDAPPRHGELWFHPTDGIELRLSDRVGREEFSREHKEYKIITGDLGTSHPVTLIDCFDTSSRQYFGGFEERRIHVNFALIGIKLSNINECAFSSISYKSPALAAWYIPGDVDVNFPDKSRNNIVINYNARSPIQSKIDEIRSITIWSGPSYSLGLNANGELPFKVETGFEISYEHLQSWRSVIADFHALEAFFCLALGKLAGPPDCHFLGSRKNEPNDTKDPTDTRPDIAELLISQPWYQRRDIGHKFDRSLLLEDMKEKVGEIFGNWFGLQQRIGRVISLYLSALRKGNSIEVEFQLFTQAIEAFHRELIGGTLLPEENFLRIKNSLFNELPSDLHVNLKSIFQTRIGFMNEPGLTKRIKDIHSELPKEAQATFSHLKKDARQIVELRNELVHVVTRRERSDLMYQRMGYFCDFLRNLFELSLFHKLGVSDGALREIVQRNYRFSYLYRNREKLFD